MWQYLLTQIAKLKGEISGSTVGDLSDLTTTDKSSAVAAINEVNDKVDNKIKVSEFAATVSTTADSNVIGGNRGEITITSELDTNYNSNVKVTIPIQIVPANATARILPCASNTADKIRFLSPSEMSEQNVYVRVLYVF